MDVALHRCGDLRARQGWHTGPDGASHHGMWDMSILQVVPGLQLAAPRDGVRFREALARSLAIDDGPACSASPRTWCRRSSSGRPARRCGHPARTEQPRVLVWLWASSPGQLSRWGSGYPTRGSG